MVEGCQAQVLRFFDCLEREEHDNLEDFLAHNEPDKDFVSNMHNYLENLSLTMDDNRYLEILYKLHQSGSHRCRQFIIQFIPSMIGIYLTMMGRLSKSDITMLDMLFLAIYNSESTEHINSSSPTSYRIPSLSNSSAYHEPCNTPSQTLTEGALSRHEQSSQPIIPCNPRNRVENLSLRSRLAILKTALQLYNKHISSLNESSYISFCKMAIRIALSGIPYVNDLDDSVSNLFPGLKIELLRLRGDLKLSSDHFYEIIFGIHYIMYNGCAQLSYMALKYLDQMLRYSLNANSRMVLCAILDSIKKRDEFQTRSMMLDTPDFSASREKRFGRRYAFSSGIGSSALSNVKTMGAINATDIISNGDGQQSYGPTNRSETASVLDQQVTNVQQPATSNIDSILAVDSGSEILSRTRHSSNAVIETSL